MSEATAKEAVGSVGELIADGDAVFGQKHGDAALDIIREVQAALMAQFEDNLGHVVLWEQFLRTPKEVDATVCSVLVSYMEHDQVLADWLDDALSRYREEAG